MDGLWCLDCGALHRTPAPSDFDPCEGCGSSRTQAVAVDVCALAGACDDSDHVSEHGAHLRRLFT